MDNDLSSKVCKVRSIVEAYKSSKFTKILFPIIYVELSLAVFIAANSTKMYLYNTIGTIALLAIFVAIIAHIQMSKLDSKLSEYRYLINDSAKIYNSPNWNEQDIDAIIDYAKNSYTYLKLMRFVYIACAINLILVMGLLLYIFM